MLHYRDGRHSFPDLVVPKDSLDLIALGVEIEEKSGIALDDKDLRDCETLGDLIDRLAARITERSR